MQVLLVHIPIFSKIFLLSKRLLTFGLFLLLGAFIKHTNATELRISDEEQLRQQQRQSALEAQFESKKNDIRITLPQANTEISLPQESTCFNIKNIELSGHEELGQHNTVTTFLKQFTDHCIGAQGIRIIMDALQEIWIAEGMVTTRVLAPQQDLSRGLLSLIVLPGKIESIRFNASSLNGASLAFALPLKEGDVLNIRDIEQGLENLQKPRSVKASFQLVPGSAPGLSHVVVDWAQERKWRLDFSANDTGSDSTGKYQGSGTLSLDNPFGLSDLLYFSVGNDLHLSNQKKTKNYTLHYSIPYQYWSLDTTYNEYNYLQTIAGLNTDIAYEGKSKRLQFDISKVIFRDNKSKVSMGTGLRLKDSKNYIEGQEVGVQRRKTAQLAAFLNYNYFANWGSLQANINYLKGLNTLGAMPPPESYYSDIDASADIIQTQISTSIPFSLLEESMKWKSHFKGQWSPDRLTTTDLLSIGSRYTVRGFDGRASLAAEKGFYLQNEIAWRPQNLPIEIYTGIDIGHVSGPSADILAGKTLAGWVVGLNGQASSLAYSAFVGMPIKEPNSNFSSSYTLGFSLSWSM